MQNLWTGAADQLWTNAANWSLATVPGPSDDVLISDTGAEAVVLNAPANVQSLTLGSQSGAATLAIAGGSLQCSGAAQVQTNSTLNLAGGLTAASLTVAGSLSWSAGSLTASNSTLIGPSGHLTMSTVSNALFGTFSNDGTFTCLATNLVVDASLQFANNNLFVLQTNCTLSGQGTFQNNGTVLVPAGSGTVPLVIGDGIIFGNRGTLRAETNAVLELQMDINSGGLTLEDGTVFDGDGLVRLAGNGSCGCAGTLQVDTTVELAGPFCVEPAVLTGRGLFRWLSGTVGRSPSAKASRCRCRALPTRSFRLIASTRAQSVGAITPH